MIELQVRQPGRLIGDAKIQNAGVALDRGHVQPDAVDGTFLVTVKYVLERDAAMPAEGFGFREVFFMRWQDLEESSSVEDRRGMGRSGGLRTRGGIPLRGKTGLAVVIVVLVAGYYGIDLTPLLTGEPFPVETQTTASAPYKGTAVEEELAKFSRVALKTTEDVWTEIFRATGERYPHPKLVLYTGSTSTACGYGRSAMGPFYCPADRKVYLDLSFYDDMQKKLGGGGDFALGYVLAHEVGHHVQTVLGISEQVQTLQQRVTKKEANALQVKMELQADCFAGVWGHFMEKRGILEAGDLEEALKTATAIGDDRHGHRR